MSRLESASTVEQKVGMKRHLTDHIGRVVSAEQRVYILHSVECRNSGIDLRDCEFSIALDRGIDKAIPWSGWRHVQDSPVRVEIFRGYLVPELATVKADLTPDAETTGETP